MKSTPIVESMKMSEVLEQFPSAKRALFQGFHIGGCNSCGYSMEDSIQEVCDKHGKNVSEVIEHIYKSEEIDQAMRIEAEAAHEWISNEKVEIIDVREPYEAEQGQIENSRLLDRPLLGEIMNTWPKETKILAYCASGQRSAEFASYLIGHGFENVKTLEGGITAFQSVQSIS